MTLAGNQQENRNQVIKCQANNLTPVTLFWITPHVSSGELPGCHGRLRIRLPALLVAIWEA